MELTNTNKALTDFAEDTVERMRFNLKLKGFGGQRSNRNKDASGKLSRSLGFSIRENPNGLVLSFTSSVNYAKFVEEGRRKGKGAPIDSIVKWIEKKPLRITKTITKNGFKTRQFAKKTPKSVRSAAFAISKSIAKRGIKGVPIFSEALESTYKKNEEEIAKALTSDVADLLFKDFQKNGSGN